MSTGEPADQAVRERALDPAQSFIVQAPAGSGKTELLIRRFLVLLGRVPEPEAVIAITFTRKAAAEMRARVLAALTQEPTADPLDPAEPAVRALARAARHNAEARGWRLDRHPARLRIQTIDALCAALARRMPWVAGLGGPVRVTEDPTLLYREAALDTVRLLVADESSWRDAVSTLLELLDNRVPRAVELLADMLAHRDQWLRHINPAAWARPQDRRRALEAAWAGIVAGALAAARASVPPEVETALPALVRRAAGNLREEDVETELSRWEDLASLPGPETRDLQAWRALGDWLLTKDDGWRRRFTRHQGVPAAGTAVARDLKERIAALMDTLGTRDGFRAALVRIRRLPEPGLRPDQWAVVAALTELLPLAAARLRLLFAERGEVDFMEIAACANRALGACDAPSELALQWDLQIRHILVDEFQDTSWTQLELLEHLTAGWQPGDGRTLFLVGDPMQSIYRFREAEVGIFRRVAEHGLGDIRPVSLTLSANFRSDPQLVDWTNMAMRHGFAAHPDPQRGGVPFVASVAHREAGADAGVEVHAMVNADAIDQALRVVEVAQRVLTADDSGTVAILVRSRPHLGEILPLLDRAGLGYVGVDVQRFGAQSVVQDLLSLTAALTQLADRIAWLAILRAPWCGLVLADLHLLCLGAGERCVWERLGDPAVTQQLSADGRARVARFRDVVGAALARRGRERLASWIRGVWVDLGGAACVDGSGLDHAERFFRLLIQHEVGGQACNMGLLREAVERRWAQSAIGDGARLQVMTLHKAKGLEFDTVIIPALERTPRRSEPCLLLWEEDLTPTGQGLLLAPLPRPGAAADPHYEYLRAAAAARDAAELQRLLYVGCTRARRALHLVAGAATGADGAVRPPRPRSLLEPLWPVVRGAFSALLPKASVPDGHAPHAPDPVAGLARLPADWRPPSAPALPAGSATTVPQAPAAGSVEFSWAGETARLVGVLVHELLQRLAERPGATGREAPLGRYRAQWRNDLASTGIAGPELESALARVEQAARHALDDPRAHWLFAAGHRDAHSEYAVSALIDGRMRRLRIDRTFVDEAGVRWIVDIKASVHEGGGVERFLDREQERYRTQLEDYARAILGIEARPVRLGLYFPVIKGWREWIYCG